MLSWIIQIIIISILFIFLFHHLISYLKNMLTVPKMKDLVNDYSRKYEGIYDVLSKPPSREDYTHIDLLPTTYSNKNIDMKDELKNFLKDQLNAPDTTTSIDSLDSLSTPYSFVE